jgi:Flp pilus assembly protein TadD
VRDPPVCLPNALSVHEAKANISGNVIGVSIVKRATLLGMLMLTTSTGGCSLLPFVDAPQTQVAAPAPNAVKASDDLQSVLRDAQAARKGGDLSAAGKMLSQLVLIAPDDARVLGEYGKTLAAEGRSDDALAFLERAIQLQPMDWSLLSAQGVAYDQKGNYQSAQLSYARALILKPGESSVLNNDALSHMQSGDLDGAETLLLQATPGTPDYPRLAQNLALVQKLKAAQPAKPMEAAPVQPVPVEPPSVAAIEPAATPVAEPEAAPVVASTPVDRAELPVPAAVSVTEAPPAPAELPAVPKDTVSPLRPLKAKSEPAALPKPMEKKPAEPAPESKPLPAVRQAGSRPLYVQAGAYFTEKQAGESASALDSLGARVMSGTVDGRAVYRVRIGPFLNVQQAKAAFARAQALGRSDLNIVRE